MNRDGDDNKPQPRCPEKRQAVAYSDLSKHGTSVLDAGYMSSGYKFKSKVGTGWDGASVSVSVDLTPGDEKIKTPAVLSWSLPKPFGAEGLSVDRLEMDKDGKYALQASAGKGFHFVNGLSVSAKSDLEDVDKTVLGLTYKGLEATTVSLATKLTKPEEYELQVTRAIGDATVGLSMDHGKTVPDVGMCYKAGPFFASLQATDKLKDVAGCVAYDVTDGLKIAAAYELQDSSKGAQLGTDDTFSVGADFKVAKGYQVKAKVQHDQVISGTLKHDLSSGLAVQVGGTYDLKNQQSSYAVSVLAEA